MASAGAYAEALADEPYNSYVHWSRAGWQFLASPGYDVIDYADPVPFDLLAWYDEESAFGVKVNVPSGDGFGVAARKSRLTYLALSMGWRATVRAGLPWRPRSVVVSACEHRPMIGWPLPAEVYRGSREDGQDGSVRRLEIAADLRGTLLGLHVPEGAWPPPQEGLYLLTTDLLD